MPRQTTKVAKGKNLFSGIAVPEGNSWYFNDNDIYEYDKDDLTSIGWKILS